jgi:hypothetical protein
MSKLPVAEAGVVVAAAAAAWGFLAPAHARKAGYALLVVAGIVGARLAWTGLKSDEPPAARLYPTVPAAALAPAAPIQASTGAPVLMMPVIRAPETVRVDLQLNGLGPVGGKAPRVGDALDVSLTSMGGDERVVYTAARLSCGGETVGVSDRSTGWDASSPRGVPIFHAIPDFVDPGDRKSPADWNKCKGPIVVEVTTAQGHRFTGTLAR